MSDLHTRAFYSDVISLLEEIVELYEEEYELEDSEELDEDDEDALNERCTLDTFIANVRDCLDIAKTNS